ncbi:hypothetical protein GALMADRAFT_271035 [Galerina marginata CBS 339.88]|uniref:Uncharacterized protein n=1 Tax=Galerina marginata (strain CBS 339.88) TaxID=685588 RepID=A0A067SNA9_GALM3|nr:hypothetical protein GALMADRAFT_271035 [Galerina marginata CBS 339.88]
MVQGLEARYEAVLALEDEAGAHAQDEARAQEASKAADEAKSLLQIKVDDHLKPLFESARAFAVGAKRDPTTIPLFVLGTAGIRDLFSDSAAPDETERIGNRQYNDLLRCMTHSSRKANFDLKECGAISGEAEALYGWIAGNCTLTFPSGWATETLGYAEMGGASAQIAFSPYRADPDRTYDGVIWKVNLGNTEFELFLGSYPLGMDKAAKFYYDKLITEHRVEVENGRRIRDDDLSPEQKVVIDPGKPSGLEKTIGIWTLRGAIYEEEKIGTTNGLHVNKLAATVASAVSTASVDSAGHRVGLPYLFNAAVKAHDFIGGANFWYYTRTIFGLNYHGKPRETPFSFREFRLEIFRTLSFPWDTIKENFPSASRVYLEEAWIKAMWANVVMSRNFRLDNDGDPTKEPRLTFRPFNGYEGMELSWTLGRLVQYITGNHETVRERDGAVQFRPFLDSRAA